MVILMGLALDLTPAVLTPSAWAIALGLVNAILAISALLRTRRSHGRCRLARGSWLDSPAQFGSRVYGRRSDASCLALSISWYAAVSQVPHRSLTALWMLPSEGRAVRLGVSNGDGEPRRYRLELKDDRGLIASWSIALGDGESGRRPSVTPAIGLVPRVMRWLSSLRWAHRESLVRKTLLRSETTRGRKPRDPCLGRRYPR